MQISIDLQTIIAVVTTMISGIVGGMVWVGSRIDKVGDKMAEKMEKIQREIGKIREDFVDNELCKERQEHCPCRQQLKTMNEMVEDIENRIKTKRKEA